MSMSSLETSTDASDRLKVDQPHGKPVCCPSGKDCTIPIDITLRSSDGIRFGAHKKNLESFSEGFPPVEWTAEKKGEIVELPEKGITLRLLLRFMHNTALAKLWKECSDMDIDDLLAFMDAADKYGVFIALQAGEEALVSRADKMSHEDLLRVLLREASRSSSNIIDEFARRTLCIPTKVGLLFLKNHLQIYMTWSLYRTEWEAWKKEYEKEMTRNHASESGQHWRGNQSCTECEKYRQQLHACLRELEEFPTFDHFTRVEVVLLKFQLVIDTVSWPAVKRCSICNNRLENWKGGLPKLFGSQKRWVDCILK
ncbi:hypothetical protein E1B28_010630 [Marasmius oreades]|uniref:BTB domain-containing protein n=1 Tax=Marasmius oreades TaxID=181124 RepID=A0A9P7RYQ5_9AGAR|nr:uncharacterized protein E1B28_010630 [Marasmius oreades]KAG7091611.1 hypothetical protein E1B28_010630 [Marasmius oreades]